MARLAHGRSVGYARRHCELLDLPVAIESYLAARRAESPPPEAWNLAQTEQALVFFARGTDGTTEIFTTEGTENTEQEFDGRHVPPSPQCPAVATSPLNPAR